MINETKKIILLVKDSKMNIVITQFTVMFPTNFIITQIKRNGGVESNLQYELYKRTLQKFRILTLLGMSLGIISAIIGNSTAFGLVIFIASMVFTVASILVSKKLKPALAMAVWHHNTTIDSGFSNFT